MPLNDITVSLHHTPLGATFHCFPPQMKNEERKKGQKRSNIALVRCRRIRRPIVLNAVIFLLPQPCSCYTWDEKLIAFATNNIINKMEKKNFAIGWLVLAAVSWNERQCFVQDNNSETTKPSSGCERGRRSLSWLLFEVNTYLYVYILNQLTDNNKKTKEKKSPANRNTLYICFFVTKFSYIHANWWE